MQNKYLIVFACLLVGLIGIYIVQKQSAKIAVVQTGIEQLLPDQDLDKVHEIRVRRGGQKSALVLTRSDQGWSMPGYFDAPVNSRKIESFLQDIKDLRGEKRASSKDVFAAFGVEDDKAVTLEFLNKEGEPLFTILAGKQGPIGNSGFVRRKDQLEVYLAEKNLPAFFGLFGDDRQPPQPELWADLELLKDSQASWTAVELIRPGAVFSFVKQHRQVPAEAGEKAAGRPPAAEVWRQRGPVHPQLNEEAIQSSLNALANLQAMRLADPAEIDAYGLEAPPYQAKISLNDGKTIQLLINRPQDKGPVYAKLADKKEIYELTEEQLQGIFQIPAPPVDSTVKPSEQKRGK